MNLGERFANYYLEELELTVVNTENGFITYKVCGEEFVIQDVYVDPDKRKQGSGRAMLTQLEAMAREKGCKFVTGMCFKQNDDTDFEKFNQKLYTMLSVGLKVCLIQGNHVILKKYL